MLILTSTTVMPTLQSWVSDPFSHSVFPGENQFLLFLLSWKCKFLCSHRALVIWRESLLCILIGWGFFTHIFTLNIYFLEISYSSYLAKILIIILALTYTCKFFHSKIYKHHMPLKSHWNGSFLKLLIQKWKQTEWSL